MSTENRLTTKEFCTSPNPSFQFERHTDHPIEELIKKYVPSVSTGECLEIGSFPGPFLAAFGDLGYTLNGIDFHPLNQTALPNWLRKQGFKTASFQTVDFFEFETTSRYDVVASFGFIEHFENYKNVILRHTVLVAEDGYLVITRPSFQRWIQRRLHITYDKENLLTHNTDSMKPDK